MNLMVLGVGSLCFAQQGEVNPDVETASPSVIPNETIELASFVDLAADTLGWNIQYDPSLLRGSVTLRVSDPLTGQAMRELLERVLAASDLTVVEAGAVSGVLTIVKEADAGAVATPRVVPGQGSALFAVEVFQTEYLDPDAAVGVLSQLLSGRGSKIERIEGTPLIMLSESESRATVLRDLLARLDVPGAAQGLRRVNLTSLSPEQATTTLIQLGYTAGAGPAGGGRSGAIRVATMPGQQAVYLTGSITKLDEVEELLRSLDASQSGSTVVYTAKRQRASDLLALIRSSIGERSGAGQFLVDENNNAIIATGTDAVHRRIAELLAILDQSPESNARTLESIEIRNRPAESVLGLLESLLDETGSGQPRPGAGAASTVPAEGGTLAPEAVTARVTEISGRVQLALDEMNNRILVSGFPADIDRVRSLVTELDIRQPQVFVEVTLVSLSEGESRDLGIELSGSINSNNTLVSLFSLFGLSSVTAGDSSIAAGSGSGGTGVILDPGDFAAVVRALETVTDGRSVSRPSILVNNNAEAVLDSVAEEPFLSQSLSDGTTATGFGGSSNAGTQISVTPMITAGDQLSLQYSISLSAFTGESSDPGLPPPRQSNSLSSTVSIPDGFTVALGGFVIENEGQAESGTPPLSWIPIIGELFKSRSASSSTSRFYIFIRASVSRDEQFRSLKYASESLLNEAEVDSGWPVTEPRIIR